MSTEFIIDVVFHPRPLGEGWGEGIIENTLILTFLPEGEGIVTTLALVGSNKDKILIFTRVFVASLGHVHLRKNLKLCLFNFTISLCAMWAKQVIVTRPIFISSGCFFSNGKHITTIQIVFKCFLCCRIN